MKLLTAVTLVNFVVTMEEESDGARSGHDRGAASNGREPRLPNVVGLINLMP